MTRVTFSEVARSPRLSARGRSGSLRQDTEKSSKWCKEDSVDVDDLNHRPSSPTLAKRIARPPQTYSRPSGAERGRMSVEHGCAGWRSRDNLEMVNPGVNAVPSVSVAIEPASPVDRYMKSRMRHGLKSIPHPYSPPLLHPIGSPPYPQSFGNSSTGSMTLDPQEDPTLFSAEQWTLEMNHILAQEPSKSSRWPEGSEGLEATTIVSPESVHRLSSLKKKEWPDDSRSEDGKMCLAKARQRHMTDDRIQS